MEGIEVTKPTPGARYIPVATVHRYRTIPPTWTRSIEGKIGGPKRRRTEKKQRRDDRRSMVFFANPQREEKKSK
jgi:hypothetical protein